MSEQTQQQNSEEAVENVETVETVEAAETAENGAGEQEPVSAEPTYEDLQARIAELEAQLKDEQLRALANEQNLRRRHQQEIADTHKFAGQKFAVEMLPVKDYLEMALLDQSGNFDALKMGVQMTLNELQKAFDATQIKEINPKAGDKLDPNIHQAMQAGACRRWPASRNPIPWLV